MLKQLIYGAIGALSKPKAYDDYITLDVISQLQPLQDLIKGTRSEVPTRVVNDHYLLGFLSNTSVFMLHCAGEIKPLTISKKSIYILCKLLNVHHDVMRSSLGNMTSEQLANFKRGEILSKESCLKMARGDTKAFDRIMHHVSTEYLFKD